jgi:hypothetical protein
VPVRDSQKQRLYDAEHAVLDGVGGRDMSIPACQAYVDQVLQSAFIQTRWGRNRIVVVPTHSNGSSRGGRIALGVWARQPSVILHEIAHELLWGQPYANHGPEFAACYLMLVGRFLGKEHEKALRESYAKHRVRYRTGMAKLPTPGTRRVVTKTQTKVAARQRVSMPLSVYEQKQAADMIRRAVATGMFGDVGRKPRTHAQAVARTLEKAYADRAPSTQP